MVVVSGIALVKLIVGELQLQTSFLKRFLMSSVFPLCLVIGVQKGFFFKASPMPEGNRSIIGARRSNKLLSASPFEKLITDYAAG
jgi:hypothetical protein